MEGLIEGRIVHFVMPSGEHRPAIVVQVWRQTDYDPKSGVVGLSRSPENGCSNLVVFVDGLNDVKRSSDDPNKDIVTTLWETSVIFSEEIKPGTWHWIEKA